MEIQINVQNKKAKIIIDVSVDEVDSIVKKLMNVKDTLDKNNVFTKRQMIGRKGGLTRAKNMSADKLSAIGKMGAKVRHKNNIINKRVERSKISKMTKLINKLASDDSNE